MRLIRLLAGQRPTKSTITGGSSEEYWSMGESLNQPSSVQDDGPMGCKLLLYGDKVLHVWSFVGTIRIRTG